MGECLHCGRSFYGHSRSTCSESCRKARRAHLARLSRRKLLENPCLLSASNSERGLEPVTRRDRQKILDGFFTEVLTLEDEVALVFSEASMMARGIQIKEHNLI